MTSLEHWRNWCTAFKVRIKSKYNRPELRELLRLFYSQDVDDITLAVTMLEGYSYREIHYTLNSSELVELCRGVFTYLREFNRHRYDRIFYTYWLPKDFLPIELHDNLALRITRSLQMKKAIDGKQTRNGYVDFRSDTVRYNFALRDAEIEVRRRCNLGPEHASAIRHVLSLNYRHFCSI